MGPFLAIAAMAVLSAPLSAEVLTICRTPGSPAAASPAIMNPGLPAALQSATALALIRDEDGYDVVINEGAAGEKSLRGAGATILGRKTGAFVHLLVIGADESAVHFLFDLDRSGAGALLWADEHADRHGGPYHATCRTPP